MSWCSAGRPCPGRSAGCWLATTRARRGVGVRGLDRSGTFGVPGDRCGETARRRGIVTGSTLGIAPTRLVRERLDALLKTQPYLTGPLLAAAVWAALDDADALFAGSSSPIRDLDLAPITPSAPLVYANRGLSGIDGNVSTAAGIALALERPTHALLGDLTALHDATGLVMGQLEPRPDLRFVVANDDGGSIFATLEQGEPAHMGAFERLFGTPQGLRFEALATAAGIDYRRVETAAELAEMLAERPDGVELVEAVIDRAHRRTLDREIIALAATL